ncbi:MAG TPA: CHASE2 domain-containing protein [Pusillimonas sp.]|uniref:CHASE2 domain-containing protein n=1 Tax=Pusillimonas sp. TaxID=3040095 RepID=UPI002B4B388E|nr:CHASE2 domain-containing protein [Pusillimonas sp.]HLU20670.1 CHASE2 domain-containing protein [Pusillimonas sp.]
MQVRGALIKDGGLDRRLRVEWLLVVSIAMLLTFLLSCFSHNFALHRLDHLLYGQTLALATRPPPEEVVIVVLDDDSIDELGQWPLRRAVHAELLARLHLAKAVGLDFVFRDASPAYPQDESILAQAMSRHGRVVLPLVVDDGRVLWPRPILAQAAAGLGIINAHLGPDSVVRAMKPYWQTAQGKVDHFVVAMLDVAGHDSKAQQLRAGDETPRLMSFAGGPGSFKMYPYARVLDDSVPSEAFEGKLVLVGAWASALGDALSVPLSGTGEPMSGVEILANGLHNALGQHWIRTPHFLVTALLSTLPVLMVCIALRRLSPRRSLLVILGLVVLIFIAHWVLMRYFHVWIGPSAALLGIMLAYPLWSWRLQEAALKQVDAELDSLYAQHLMHFQALPQDDIAVRHSLPHRLVRLHQAMGMVRQAIGLREEALRFLSHDMRSPQNTILALVQLQRRSRSPMDQMQLLDRIERSACRTLRLVDGFVRLARAESMELNLNEIDLAGLLQSVCDEQWPMAHHRNITISVEGVERPAFTMADEDQLRRALGNLVTNAIQYSPQDGRIWCRLRGQGSEWVIEIEDKGRGMAADQISRLFHPFRRFDAEVPDNPAGIGLGLALVRAVVLRHGGRISVESQPGQGSTFRVSLPVFGSGAATPR